MSQAIKQPTLFEVFGRNRSAVIPAINENALNSITDILTTSGEELGKTVLLRSPRAGYGKTLLLQSASNRLNESFRFLAVEPSGGGRIDGEVVLDSVMRQLSEVLPAAGGLTEFDLFARRLLALGLKPLLISGEIPSHDREGALFAIENRPVETFDFHHQQALTAHWTQANFEVLGPRLASELSELSGCSLRGCAYWIELLFQYATTPPEKVERTRFLSDTVLSDSVGQSGAEERLQSLLALLGLIEPVVLVFDETEGLSNQPEAGLRVAAFVVQVRQACPSLTVILSVNEDVWETGLKPLMPGGLIDRLTEYEVSLSELTREEAESLLVSRFGSNAQKISANMSWNTPLSSRAVLREGAAVARTIELPAEEPILEAASFGAAATPPPLTDAIADLAGLEQKTKEILEPTAFEATPPKVEEGQAEGIVVAPEPEPEPEPLAQPSPSESPATAEFAVEVEPEPEIQEKAVSPSPFGIVAATPAVEIVAETNEVTSPSPFDAVAKAAPAEQSPRGDWSAEAALEQFASTQSDEPAMEAVRSVDEKIGGAFDEKPAAETAIEKSPFQAVQEARGQKLAGQQCAEVSNFAESAPEPEPSPFSVTEPEEKPSPFTQAEPVAAQVIAEPTPSPFSATSQLVEEEIKPAAAQGHQQASASQPLEAHSQFAQPVQPVQVEPQTQPEPASKPATPAVSPFSNVESPFAAAPSKTEGEGAEEVEQLLSQFKKRFGQTES